MWWLEKLVPTEPVVPVEAKNEKENDLLKDDKQEALKTNLKKIKEKEQHEKENDELPNVEKEYDIEKEFNTALDLDKNQVEKKDLTKLTLENYVSALEGRSVLWNKKSEILKNMKSLFTDNADITITQKKGEETLNMVSSNPKFLLELDRWYFDHKLAVDNISLRVVWKDVTGKHDVVKIDKAEFTLDLGLSIDH